MDQRYFLMRIFLPLLIAALVIPGSNLRSQTFYSDYQDGMVYFRCQVGTSIPIPYDSSIIAINPMISKYGITDITQPFSGINTTLDRVYCFEFNQYHMVDTCLQALQSLPWVEYAEYAPVFHLDYSPNDYNQFATPYFEQVSALQGWDISKGDANVVIAIVDNGIRLTHNDLDGALWTNSGEIPNNGLDDDLNGYVDDVFGYDVADRDGNPSPPSSTLTAWSHGTHVGGIAGAESDNFVGNPSIGFNSRLMAIKCARSADSGNTLVNAYDGVTYAIRNGADIINMSFGGPTQSITGEAIIDAAFSQGIVLVAAAGNDNVQSPSYPAAYSNVISVGAVDENDERSFFSNYGNTIDIMAPGNNIRSTAATGDNDYINLFGTSMASPMVAGAAALLRAEFPGDGPNTIKNRLLNGADPIDHLNPGEEGLLGAGRLNVFRSLGGSVDVEEISPTAISFYPNPATEFLYINTDGDQSIQLINAQGQRVKTINALQGINELSLVNLQPGVYLIQFSAKNSATAEQLVILK